MPFNVSLKQYPDDDDSSSSSSSNSSNNNNNNNPNHFEYQMIVAVNTRLDANIIKVSLDNLLDSLRATHREATYLLFKLENPEGRFDESVIGRVVTTQQLIDILNTDEFIEESSACSLLLGAITVTHYLILQAGVVYDTGMDDGAIPWTPEAFAEHDQHRLWRIDD